jgi:hypothetical protein
MKKSKLPKIDSIQELAEFWDTHDLTEFEDELVEVTTPVFVRETAIKVPLASREAKAVERMAHTKGVTPEELIRGWVIQKLGRPNRNGRTKRGD